MTAVVWFRNDLRVRDNPALFKAADAGEGVIGVYVHCEAYVQLHTIASSQLDFIRRNLKILQADLQRLNIPLHVIKVKKIKEIAPTILRITQQLNASHLYFNAEYPINEINRDMAVNQLLRENAILVKRCHDRCIVPPGMIRNGQGEPYKVFTAFKKKWLQMVMPINMQPYGVPAKQSNQPFESATGREIDQLFAAHKLIDLSELWPAGENEAYRRLDSFIEKAITRYQELRDFPAIDGTSTLSPYLAVGAISPRQAIAAVLAFTRGEWEGGNSGANCWIGELIWREFYQHIAADFPQVCKRKAMQPHTEAFPWSYDQSFFKAWCEGRTGIPIVDAAMRQLNSTGWMHNRLRMVVAMFLTKNCQIDWRLGENYFMSKLIDGDFAANNGGWQWSASTGTDAAPYFRIFNPISQSERFDPQGDFIRKWLPELAHLSNRHIHNPPPMDNYPSPLVDLSETRKSTIALFAQLPKNGNYQDV